MTVSAVASGTTTIAVGTDKGAYLLTAPTGSDPADTAAWTVTGPQHEGWKVTAFGHAPDGRALAATGSNWFGVAIHASQDLQSWEQLGAPAWTDAEAEDGRTMAQVWTLHTMGDAVYAGVADAGLFRSTDLQTWEPVTGFNEHPTRVGWQPGLGGLCTHRILDDGVRLWTATSSVGVMRTDDGGASFTRHDGGVPRAVSTEDGALADGWCVHGIAHDPSNPDRIWRQDHQGVFRTIDGGDSWERIQSGLPNESGFGFPILRDHASGRLFVAPLHSDANRVLVDGKLAIYASDDDGDSWHVAGTGWPSEPNFAGILRGSFATDQAGTLAAGTTSGAVWASTDTGESWARLPGTFPRIHAITVWTAP